MKIEKVLEKRDRASERLISLFIRAENSCMTSKELDEGIRAIRESVLDCPQYVGQYLSGITYALRHKLYYESLEFGAYVDGVYYSCNSRGDNYYEKHGISAKIFAEENKSAGHYWKKDTSKPFFIG